MIQKRNSFFVISKSSIIYWSFLLPNLLGVLCFFLLPMLQVLIRSFQSAIGGNCVAVRNYITVVNNAAFQRAITNTGKFTAICIPLLIVISLVLVVLLYSTPGICSTLRSIFLMPMAVPAASVVLVWKVLFHENGLINGALRPWAAMGSAGWDQTLPFGAGDQLSLEKLRLYHDPVDRRTISNPGRNR